MRIAIRTLQKMSFPFPFLFGMIFLLSVGVPTYAQYWGTGMSQAYGICPYNMQTGSGATNADDDIAEIKQNSKDKKADLKEKKKDLADIEKIINLRKSQLEKILNPPNLTNLVSCFEKSDNNCGSIESTIRDGIFYEKEYCALQNIGIGTGAPAVAAQATTAVQINQFATLNSQQQKTCATNVADLVKKINEKKKVEAEILQIEDDLKNLESSLADAKIEKRAEQVEARREAREQMTEGGCIGCQIMAGSSYQPMMIRKKPSTIDMIGNAFVGLSMGLGAMYFNNQSQQYVSDNNAKLGIATQTYPSFLAGFPYFMGGLYGALGGGVGTGAYGCGGGFGGTGFPMGAYAGANPFMTGMSGMMSPMGGAFGYPGSMFGSPMGGGMYMPGFGSFGMGGPGALGLCAAWPCSGGGMGAGFGFGPYSGMPGLMGGMPWGAGYMGGGGGYPGFWGGIPGLGQFAMGYPGTLGLGGGYGMPFGMGIGAGLGMPGLGGLGGYGMPYGLGGLGGLGGGYGMPGMGMGAGFGMPGLGGYGMPYGLGGLGGLGGGYGMPGMGGMDMGMQMQIQNQMMQMQMQQYQAVADAQRRRYDNYVAQSRVINNLTQELVSIQMRIQQAQVMMYSGGTTGFDYSMGSGMPDYGMGYGNSNLNGLYYGIGGSGNFATTPNSSFGYGMPYPAPYNQGFGGGINLLPPR